MNFEASKAMKCIKFKSFPSGSLLGFADFYIDKWKAEIHGCRLYQKDGRRWVQLPSTEYQKDGETKYSPIIRFTQKEHWDEFVKRAKEAIDIYCRENPQPEMQLDSEPGVFDTPF